MTNNHGMRVLLPCAKPRIVHYCDTSPPVCHEADPGEKRGKGGILLELHFPCQQVRPRTPSGRPLF